MNAKVVRLVDLVERGYAIESVVPRRDGGLRMRLAQGPEGHDLAFAFYEIPAILQATRVIGSAG